MEFKTIFQVKYLSPDDERKGGDLNQKAAKTSENSPDIIMPMTSWISDPHVYSFYRDRHTTTFSRLVWISLNIWEIFASKPISSSDLNSWWNLFSSVTRIPSKCFFFLNCQFYPKPSKVAWSTNSQFPSLKYALKNRPWCTCKHCAEQDASIQVGKYVLHKYTILEVCKCTLHKYISEHTNTITSSQECKSTLHNDTSAKVYKCTSSQVCNDVKVV